MKIAILGGAGAMARTVVRDLSENPEVEEILLADYRGNIAEEVAHSFKDSRIKGCFVDAKDINQTASILKGYDALINSAQHYINLDAMRACLEARCHYTDLGGLFHITLQQLELFESFKQAGLTAVICMGSAPGITNVLARYAYDELDTVEKVVLCDGIADMTDMKGNDVFIPPYSIRTIMSEFADDAVMYADGSFNTISPLEGVLEINFPEPIGKRKCIQTLHSEPATISTSFKDKGVKEVIWCLSLPPALEEKAKFLASLGFNQNELIRVGSVEVAPIDALAAVIEKQVEEKCCDIEIEINDIECLRVQVTGKKGEHVIEYVIDCIVRPNKKWGCSSGDVCTGVPPSIVAQMLAKGTLQKPGVWAPEQALEPMGFFKELSSRGMRVYASRKFELN